MKQIINTLLDVFVPVINCEELEMGQFVPSVADDECRTHMAIWNGLSSAYSLHDLIDGKRIVHPMLKKLNEWQYTLIEFCISDYRQRTGEDVPMLTGDAFPSRHVCELTVYDMSYVFYLNNADDNPIYKLVIVNYDSNTGKDIKTEQDIETVRKALNRIHQRQPMRQYTKKTPHKNKIETDKIERKKAKAERRKQIYGAVNLRIKSKFSDFKAWLTPWYPVVRDIVSYYGFRSVADDIIVNNLDTHIGQRFTPKRVRRYYEIIYKLLDFIIDDTKDTGILTDAMIALSAWKTSISYEHAGKVKLGKGAKYVVDVLPRNDSRFTYGLFVDNNCDIVELIKFTTDEHNVRHQAIYEPYRHKFLNGW